jgi:hypothetical protein
MSARGRDNVGAIRFDVEARAEDTGSTPDGLSEVSEEIMRSSSTGETDHCLGELAVCGFELIQRETTTMAWIQIEDNEVTGGTGRDRNIGIRMVGPPSIDLLGVRRGIFTAMSSERVFSGVGTIRFATSALPISHAMAGKNRPASRGIRQGRGKLRIVERMLR